MRIGIMITAFAMLLLSVGNASAAQVLTSQVLTGKWSGKSATTLEFLDNSKIKYCYKTKCTTQAYTGNKEKKIKFSWGRSKFTFTKTDSGYDGTFLRVSTAKVKIQ